MTKRQPRGIPVGGQFAESARAEADIPLGTAGSAEETIQNLTDALSSSSYQASLSQLSRASISSLNDDIAEATGNDQTYVVAVWDDIEESFDGVEENGLGASLYLSTDDGEGRTYRPLSQEAGDYLTDFSSTPPENLTTDEVLTEIDGFTDDDGDENYQSRHGAERKAERLRHELAAIESRLGRPAGDDAEKTAKSRVQSAKKLATHEERWSALNDAYHEYDAAARETTIAMNEEVVVGVGEYAAKNAPERAVAVAVVYNYGDDLESDQERASSIQWADADGTPFSVEDPDTFEDSALVDIEEGIWDGVDRRHLDETKGQLVRAHEGYPGNNGDVYAYIPIPGRTFVQREAQTGQSRRS